MEESKKNELEQIEKLLLFLNETIGSQEEVFAVRQLQLIQRALEKYKQVIFSTKKREHLSIFIECIKKEISLSNEPKIYKGLSAALNDYVRNMKLIKERRYLI